MIPTSLLTAQRFFARPRTFDLECPHCGLVYRIRLDTADTTWNPRTARFRCNASGGKGESGCGKVYIIGICAWPIGKGPGSNVPPADQVPGPRQLAQLRQEGQGWWLPDTYTHKGRPDPTNLTSEPDRPEPEDSIDLQLADDGDAIEHRCQQCWREYNPLKSKAQKPERYCSATCEEKDA